MAGGDRMRRIDEVMRKVIGSAIASELEDPRIGFVTVTAVETSPDLRSARVYVSVLGDEAEREATLAALASSHGKLQAAIAREVRIKHTPTLTLPLRRRPSSAASGSAGCSRTERVTEPARDGHRAPPTSTWSSTSCAAADRFLLTTHEGPDGDALGSLLAMHHDPRPARQGLGDVPGGEGVPAPGRVPLPAARRRSSTSRRPTSSTARSSSSTAATSTGCRSSSCAATAPGC